MKKLIFTLSIILSVSQLHAQYTISTVAGTGTDGYSGDNGLATAADVGWLLGICLDASGNIYFADNTRARVRRIDAVTGIITTVVGVGLHDNSGDSGPATAAHIHAPRNVVIDKENNMYISCRFCIRRVDGITGIITTIAGDGITGGNSGDGGPATAALVATPSSLAVDHSGNLYFADQNANVVRRIDKTTGIITRYAGVGPAGYSGDGGPATNAHLDFCYAIAMDNYDNLYIGNNNRIRRVDPISGIITTMAGNGTASYAGNGVHALMASMYTPLGIAVDGAGNIYFTDQEKHVVRRIDAATNIVRTIAGTSESGFSGDGGPAVFATLNRPFGICVNNTGSTVYFTDKVNYRVRKLYAAMYAGVPNTGLQQCSVYPNPTGGMVTISGLPNDEYKGHIINALGQTVHELSFTGTGTNLQLSHLPSGIYQLMLHSKEVTITERLSLIK